MLYALSIKSNFWTTGPIFSAATFCSIVLTCIPAPHGIGMQPRPAPGMGLPIAGWPARTKLAMQQVDRMRRSASYLMPTAATLANLPCVADYWRYCGAAPRRRLVCGVRWGPAGAAAGSSIAPGGRHRSDAATVERARRRLHSKANTSVDHCDFRGFAAPQQSFDVIMFVASIHHQPLQEALAKRANYSSPAASWPSCACGEQGDPQLGMVAAVWPIAWVETRLHRETRDIGAPVTEPHENLDQTRQVANEVLPNAEIRRRLYYPYRFALARPGLAKKVRCQRSTSAGWPRRRYTDP